MRWVAVAAIVLLVLAVSMWGTFDGEHDRVERANRRAQQRQLMREIRRQKGWRE